ncbi:MAG: class GN sortase [Woeseiaceae bacterium]|nr:class GN sortase [Woeseiaceae bacterium]
MSARLERSGALVVAALLGLGFWQLGQGAYIPAKAWVAQELMQRAWLRGAEGSAQPVPWPWADTWPVARLTARAGAIELIVLAGGSGRTLAFGPGHLSASAIPGETGNSVIAGHRDTHFRFLKDLEIGETLMVETIAGRRHVFEVVDVDVVDARRGSLVLDTDTSLLSLVTCYPFDAVEPGGPLRYVVTARKIR